MPGQSTHIQTASRWEEVIGRKVTIMVINTSNEAHRGLGCKFITPAYSEANDDYTIVNERVEAKHPEVVIDT